MATGMQINSTAIQAPMDEAGSYTFDPGAPIIVNGRGLAVTTPYATVRWQFETLTPAQMAWWCTTLLNGAASVEFNQCKLFNHLGSLTTYSHCVVTRPTYERFQDGLLYGVQVTIDRIY